MKLDENQKAFRNLFRTLIIAAWVADNKMMTVIFEMSQILGISDKEVCEIARNIPSIGRLSWESLVRVWVGHNYPAVSDALFDADVRAATTLFITKNHRPVSKYNAAKVSAKRNQSKIDQIRTLNSEKGDRWAKSDWKLCK